MSEFIEKEKGWKPIPLPLKVLSVVFILWMIGSVMNLSNLYENGMPLFGNFVFGMKATILPLLLDITGPLTFLFALWTRKAWAANCLLYTSPSPRDQRGSRMPSSA